MNSSFRISMQPAPRSQRYPRLSIGLQRFSSNRLAAELRQWHQEIGELPEAGNNLRFPAQYLQLLAEASVKLQMAVEFV